MDKDKQEEKNDDDINDINIGREAIDIINEKIAKNERFFSFEYYPPKTDKGVKALKERLFRMNSWNPQWMDCTWGAGGITSDLTPEICNHIQNPVKGNCMMHLTCTNMKPSKVDVALKKAKEMGCKNILALRGDPPKGEEEWTKIEGGFGCALDLIKYIKKQYGDYFCLTVAGYPEGHPLVRKPIDDDEWDPKINKNPRYWAPRMIDDGSWEGVSPSDWKKELNYLKSKCIAGGKIIITQLFYDPKVFIDYVKECRKFGINVPILPGIMPIRNYGLFNRMCGFCKTVIPEDLKTNLFQLKDDNIKLYEYGMNYVYKMCEEILKAKDEKNKFLVPGIHIYTMNTEKPTIELLSRCKIGFEDENCKNYINSELQRVLEAVEKKRIEKEEKEKEEKKKMKLETNESTITKQFKPMQTF